MSDDYILVKDKDGQLKYYRNGQFFSVAEINTSRQQQKTATKIAQKKIEPVLTFTAGKEADRPRVKAVVSPAGESKKNAHLEFEDLSTGSDWSQRREEDKRLVDQYTTRVIEKLKISFGDAKIKERFNNLLATFFRDLRTEKEVEYVLGLPKMSGGLEIPKEKAALILIVLREEKAALLRERRDLAQQHFIPPPAIDVQHRLEPPPPVPVTTMDQRVVIDSQVNAVTPQTEKNVVAPKQIIVKPTAKAPAVSATKPRLEDFRVTRKLIGPVEELREMDLVSLRRLGKEEQQIFEVLLEKFHVLAEQSLTQKISGLQAWKKSPAFQLYLSMTLQGMRERKNIAAIIEDRQIKNEDTLTLSEYEMIGRLNRQIEIK